MPDRLIAACADAGLLVLTCGYSHQVVRWIPPINVDAAEIAEAVEIFGETLAVRDSRRRALTPDSNERPSPQRAGAQPLRETDLAVLGQELHDVVEPEPTIATLAHPVERQLAAIAEPLHRVDMQMEHVSDLGRGEHRSQFVDGHRCHWMVASLRAVSR